MFVGDTRAQFLPDPQSLNAYSYSEGNPITKEDPNGKQFVQLAASYAGNWALNQATNVPSVQTFAINLGNQYPLMNSAMNHPILAGGATFAGLASIVVPGSEALESLGLATEADVSTGFSIRNTIISGVYGAASLGNAYYLPEYFSSVLEANSPRSYVNVAGETALRALPATGSIMGTSASLLLSNVGTGVSSLTALYESLGYANRLLTAMIAMTHSSSQNSPSNAVSAGGSSGSSSHSSATGGSSSSNNGGWGSSHSACGTLCQ